MGLWCVSIPARADGVDDFSRALDPKMSVESMVIAGVVGKTVDNLRDPRSVQIKTVGYGRLADVAVGCLEYRAKNGFGGMVEGYSVWRLSVVKKKPSLLFTMDKAGDWNKHCAKASMADRTAIARRVLDKIRDDL
jgi:hypothetical protein